MPEAKVVLTQLNLPGGRMTPGMLAITETFEVTVVQMIGGVRTQLLKRNPLRTGIIFIAGPVASQGLGVMPRYITDDEVLIIPRQTGIIPITMDLYRSAVMSEWWGVVATDTGVEVIEMELT